MNDEITGNGALTYPIGLITTDEALLAGGHNNPNSNYYLFTGNSYWTMSPYGFGDAAKIRGVYSNGYVSGYIPDAYFSIGVRSVINLKPNSLKSGDETMSNPYHVN